MTRHLGILPIVGCMALSAWAPMLGSQRQDPNAAVRAELERRYAENAAAFMKSDLKAIMALRAPDFHTVSPDGVTQDRAAMARYTEGLLNGIKKWNKLTQTIDSLQVVGDIDLGGDDLESDHTVENRVMGLVDGAHAAPADPLEDAILADPLGHGWMPARGGVSPRS